MVGLALLAGWSGAIAGPPKPSVVKGKLAKPVFKSGDVVATVEGQPITRRELTYDWLQVEWQTASMLLGRSLVDRWKADRGAASAYTVPLSEIYEQLYGKDKQKAGNVLSGMITNRLVAIIAKRAGIIVTDQDARASAHAFWEEYRQKEKVHFSDDELLTMLHIPRDIFLDDMAYRLRSERLLAHDIAQRNGHPIGPEDWVEVCELQSPVEQTADFAETEQKFVEARRLLDGWLKEMQAGKTMEALAREHNRDGTEKNDGRRGPFLRGTGTPAIEAAIYHLKMGEISAPQRSREGWYVFKLLRTGSQITPEERALSWKQVVAAKMPAFLIELRRKAKITSTIPLPPLESLPGR